MPSIVRHGNLNIFNFSFDILLIIWGDHPSSIGVYKEKKGRRKQWKINIQDSFSWTWMQWSASMRSGGLTCLLLPANLPNIFKLPFKSQDIHVYSCIMYIYIFLYFSNVKASDDFPICVFSVLWKLLIFSCWWFLLVLLSFFCYCDSLLLELLCLYKLRSQIPCFVDVKNWHNCEIFLICTANGALIL